MLLDPDNEIKEISKDNNSGKLVIAIPSNGTKNLYPLPYSIVNNSIVDFLFQDTDLLSAKRDFQIEIDTVNSFDSPYLRKQKISGIVLAKISLMLLSKDSLVYFWRTKFDKSKEGESKDWATTSFTYIKDSPQGWAQFQGVQLSENKLTELTHDPVKGLAFTEVTSEVFVRTFGSSNPASFTSVSVKINNAEYNLGTQSQPCRNNTINLIAFNKTTTVPYPGIPFNFQDPRTCGREPQLINSFTRSEIETGLGDDLLTYVNNIGVSDSVVIFSIGDPGSSLWSANVQNKLGEFGIAPNDITSLQQGEPLIIFGRKGASPGTAKIFKTTITPEKEQEIQVTKSITGRAVSGKINSVLIGPAQSWNKLITKVSKVEPSDMYNFTIIGVKPDGTESLLQDNINQSYGLSSIDAVIYPYLKIQLTTKDELNLTPVQLKNWLVLYEPVAEGILLHKSGQERKTVQEGAPWSDQFKFVNITDKDFLSSLPVDVEVFNKTKLQKDIQKIVIKGPARHDSTIFTIMVNTKSKVGLNDLTVFVNRKIVTEQYYDNNGIALSDYINVIPDDTRPSLDVSIDGRYLRNLDYVSANPFILVQLKDENPFMFKTDTIGVNIFLRSPCEAKDCNFVRINLSSSEVKWFPAAATSDFRVEFKPQALIDGEYTLRVEASDATGNASSKEPYQVMFMVKNETTLALTAAFPNPSAGDFFFQFQLTGNILPDYFSLQVFTTDGRLVQEFIQDDIVDFNLGLNELIWQARDTSGNTLPNGMYIYRMTINVNDKEIKQQGKLVLSR